MSKLSDDEVLLLLDSLELLHAGDLTRAILTLPEHSLRAQVWDATPGRSLRAGIMALLRAHFRDTRSTRGRYFAGGHTGVWGTSYAAVFSTADLSILALFPTDVPGAYQRAEREAARLNAAVSDLPEGSDLPECP